MALSVGHPRGTHSRYVIGCCLIPLGICGLKNQEQEVQRLLKFVTNDVYAFSEDHRMKLNPTKCKVMLINFMSTHNFIVNPIVIGSNTIERVVTYKLLGVYVSNDLKWNHHVEVIVQKGNRRLYSLRVLKQCGAPPPSLAKVYTTIVRPVLEYAAPV